MSFSKVASVIVDLALDTTLDYGIPDTFLPQVSRGVHVQVPVRGQLRKGVVLSVDKTSPFPNLAPIHAILSEEELVSEELFELALWMSNYYCASMRQVLKIILPASVRQDTAHKTQYFVKRKLSLEQLRILCIDLREAHPSQALVLEALLKAPKGILLTELLEKTGVSKSPVETLAKKNVLHIDRVQFDRSPLIGEEYFRTHPKPLSEEQQLAYDAIVTDLRQGAFATHLLHGVTGSGKTEVYLQAIEEALRQKKGTIMLVPEISLTPQTIERFRSRFEGHIAILHHRLSKGERHDEWHRIRRGEASIVIGARSALFSPVKNLGLLIVDEEHDGAYKQSEEMPCYHARDVAVMRAKIRQCVALLGSATPCLESTYNAQTGKYRLSILDKRADRAQMPSVKIIDMKREREKGNTTFSDALLDGIKKRLEKGEQTLLFLNRRGYHTNLFCSGCGHVFKCSHCDVSLTFHRNDNLLACHLCDARLSPPPRHCPKCRHETLRYRGLGTEQLERSLHALFPDIRTLRADGDTTRHKGSHERLFRDFRTGKCDLLVGTQMIAKGLHFPSVTLVAIINCDGALQLPDFRASENIFQLITQVSGRAGRGELPGEVIIQTYLPDNPTIQWAAQNDYAHFYQEELEVRKAFGYPPFSHLVKLTFSGPHQNATQEIAAHFCNKLTPLLPSTHLIHPLLPCGYPKVKDHYRFQCLIRGPTILPVNRAIHTLRKELTLPRSLKFTIDIDPLSTFF